jgi:hypothetical protein
VRLGAKRRIDPIATAARCHAPIRRQRLEPLAAPMVQVAQAQPRLRLRRIDGDDPLEHGERLVVSARSVCRLAFFEQARERVGRLGCRRGAGG